MTAENLRIDYRGKSDKDQAKIILDHALAHLNSNPGAEVGITYSANESQTNAIRDAHNANEGSGAQCVAGANQAAVVKEINTLLSRNNKYASLRDKFKIIPISTMTASGGNVYNSRVRNDLDYAKGFAERNHLIVWGNQTAPIAIGGGVAKNIQSNNQKQMIERELGALIVQAPAPEPPVRSQPPSSANMANNVRPARSANIANNVRPPSSANIANNVRPPKFAANCNSVDFLSESKIQALHDMLDDNLGMNVVENKEGDETKSVAITDDNDNELALIGKNEITTTANGDNRDAKINAVVRASAACAGEDDIVEIACDDKQFLADIAKEMLERGLNVRIPDPAQLAAVKEKLSDEDAAKLQENNPAPRPG